MAGGKLDQWSQKRFEHLFERRRSASSLRLKTVQQRHPSLVQRSRIASNHFIQKAFLRSEVVMDGGQIDPGVSYDVPQRSCRVPAVAEQPFSRVEDSLSCVYHSFVLYERLNYTYECGGLQLALFRILLGKLNCSPLF
jgi:hypothetical protein